MINKHAPPHPKATNDPPKPVFAPDVHGQGDPDRSVACNSAKNAAAASTTAPPRSISRYGSHTESDATSRPASGTINAARSR
jgi:hypothetical protein